MNNIDNYNEIVVYNPIYELLQTKKLSRKGIMNLADNFVKNILLEGSGVKELVQVNALKILIERIDKNLRELIGVIEKHSYKGVTIETVSGATILNYEQDSEYNRLNDLIKHRKKMLMQQYKLSRSPDNVGKEFIGIVGANGEQITVVEAKSDRKSTLKLSFPE